MADKNQRVIHIEDSKEYRDKVRESLAPVKGLEVVQFGHYEGFIHSPDYSADLYVLDRHFPRDARSHADDKSWKMALKLIEFLGDDNKVLMLSHKVPENGDWRSFKCLKEFLSKDNFNPDEFRQKALWYLGRLG
jgi:hypothetical protein